MYFMTIKFLIFTTSKIKWLNLNFGYRKKKKKHFFSS